MLPILLSFGILASMTVALPSGWMGSGLATYTIIQEDSYPGEPASRLQMDDCSDHNGGGSGASYWAGPDTTPRGSSDAITIHFDDFVFEQYVYGDAVAITSVILRNSNCGSYNGCGVKDFQVQYASNQTTIGQPSTDAEALEWNWTTFLSGTLPDPRNVACADRQYYSFMIPADVQELYLNLDNESTPVYVRFVASTWWGDYPAMEFMGFSTGSFEWGNN